MNCRRKEPPTVQVKRRHQAAGWLFQARVSDMVGYDAVRRTRSLAQRYILHEGNKKNQTQPTAWRKYSTQKEKTAM
jgi:hypothetical protein